MSDILDSDATEIAGKIAAREVSSREVVAASIDRINKVNPLLNVIVTDDFDRALRAADRADEALASGRSLGPLHGVPVTVKDTFKVAGVRCTAGAPELSEYVPEEDASCVKSLRDAGAIVLAKTSTPYFAGDVFTFNDVIGLSKNPHDPSRTPGGSSGGAAAALASGMSAMEAGSDIAGSIRIPAHYCGVCGHRPSYGVIPLQGHIPGPPDTISNDDLAANGPMARSIRDLQLAMSLMGRPDPAFYSGHAAWPQLEARPANVTVSRIATL
ncbi:MAG: amidase family protein [Pseudomonadota bacterium]